MNDHWFEAFRSDPDQAVSDLFSGRAGVGSHQRLDIPELLYQAFPPTSTNERVRLDRALLSWLYGMREEYPTHVERLGFSVYGKRVGDALIALHLLDLTDARQIIRSDLDAWLHWLQPLRIAAERDPALECFRLLTRGQPEPGHTAMWLRLAADRRPEYLTVALAGLRLLPNRHDAQKNQLLMVQAVLRHAVKTHPQTVGARTFFNRRFAALRGFYPRSPQHWEAVLGEALEEFLEYAPDKTSSELVDLLRTQWLAQVRHTSFTRNPALVPVPQEEWEGLEADITSSDHPPETLAQRLFTLLEQNHRYAESTGVSHFFVRTLHNLGTLLLRRHQLGHTEMTRFGAMIERALVWERTNHYCWMLWADWFRARGMCDAHESTLREMLRLFPHSEHARVELARLLINQGKETWDEAEHWLQQAMKQNPDSEHARVVMARLLVMRDRAKEAEAILAEFVERHPESQTAWSVLNRLRAGLNSATDAFYEVRENGIPAAGSHHLPERLPRALQELFRRGRLGGEFSRARIAGTPRHEAGTDFIREETRRGDPIAGFYSQWLLPKETPECPPHAWAWNACQHWQDSARTESWRHLATRFPEAAAETEFLHILAGAGEDKQTPTARWRARYCRDNDHGDAGSRAVDVFMREAQEQLATPDVHERDELALAVMACAAADAPEFVPEWDA